MCGRYSLATPNPAEVRAAYPIGDDLEVVPRFNVAPGDSVLAVTADREGRPRGEMLRWGLVPPWARSPETGLKMINARVETAAERPAYRGAVDRFRCLVLADGFYEWRRRGDGRKEAFWITRAGGGLFAFAGLWSSWRDGSSPGAAVWIRPRRGCARARSSPRPPMRQWHRCTIGCRSSSRREPSRRG